MSKCTKCNKILQGHTAGKVLCDKKNHYTTNIQAVLGQISTGGGASHLEEQMAAIQVPTMRNPVFVEIERSLGNVFNEMVVQGLLSAGKEERQLAIDNGQYHQRIYPAITVVVDGGWSKRAHKHSYNAKSGVGVIFGAATQKLLYIGVRNKYCSVCAIHERKQSPVPEHRCFKNWNGSSCAMESDIIAAGFKESWRMHGVRYLWLIGDGDSSVHHAIQLEVTEYGHDVQKVECANHAVKCFHNRMESFCNSHPEY